MQGNELLVTIRQLASDAKAAVFFRHAHRYPIVDPERPTEAEITPEGAAMARSFGERISGFDRLRFFHSPVKRCEQTAECIAQGASSAGLSVELIGSQPTLGVDYILDLKETGRLNLVHGEHFVRLWIDGRISPDLILPPAQIATAKLAYLTGKLREADADGKRLDLHVSHDWNVMILRELTLGIRHEDTGWLSYLDGMGFSLHGDKLRAMYRDRALTRPLPWEFNGPLARPIPHGTR